MRSLPVPSHFATLFAQYSASLAELLITEKNPISRSGDYLLIGDLCLALKFLADGSVGSPKTAGLPKCDCNDHAMTIIHSSLHVLYLMHRTLSDDTSPSHNAHLAGEILRLYQALSSPVSTQSPAALAVSPSSLFAAAPQQQTAAASHVVSSAQGGIAWLSLTGNQELCLTFSNSAERDEAYQALIRSSGQQNISSNHRIGQAFARNPGGQTPVTYASNPDAIYFPTYSADSSATACNFMCPMIRSAFLATLGLIGCREDDLFSPQLFSQAHHTFYDTQGNELAHTRAIGGSGEPNTCALFFPNRIFNQTIEIDMRQPPAGFFSRTTLQDQHHNRVRP